MSCSANRTVPILAVGALLAFAILAAIALTQSSGQRQSGRIPSQPATIGLVETSPVTSHALDVSWAVRSSLGSTMEPLFDVSCPIGGRMSVIHCAYCLMFPHFLMRGVGCPNWLNGYK